MTAICARPTTTWFQGAKAAEFVYDELGLTKAATIHDGTSYAQALQQVFADAFEREGGTITIQEAVGGEDTDMGPVLTTVAATEPEIIYYPVFTGPYGYITAQVADVPGLEDVVLMAADGSFSARPSRPLARTLSVPTSRAPTAASSR